MFRCINLLKRIACLVIGWRVVDLLGRCWLESGHSSVRISRFKLGKVEGKRLIRVVVLRALIASSVALFPSCRKLS